MTRLILACSFTLFILTSCKLIIYADGVVYDASTGAPMEGVRYYDPAFPNSIPLFTDSAGNYSISRNAMHMYVIFTKEGYHSQTLFVDRDNPAGDIHLKLE